MRLSGDADQGVLRAEAASAYQCLANGGFDCTGFDTDGDGTEETFTPTPKSACMSEQQAQLTCESEAGCDRFCADGICSSERETYKSCAGL